MNNLIKQATEAAIVSEIQRLAKAGKTTTQAMEEMGLSWPTFNKYRKLANVNFESGKGRYKRTRAPSRNLMARFEHGVYLAIEHEASARGMSRAALVNEIVKRAIGVRHHQEAAE